jgi:tetratricopeptide (TPR) repeat protein
MRLQLPGKKPPAHSAPAPASDEETTIAAVQEHIDEIKRVLQEKTPIMRVWGTLADLYALKAAMQARVVDAAVEQGAASPDAIDESMGEYAAGYKDYQAGSLTDAEAHLVASIDLLGWNVLARLTLGNLFFVAGEHGKAEAALTAALPHCEGAALSEVLTNLGMNAFKAGRVPDAEGHFTRAIEVDPANAYALNNLGLVNEDREDPDGAISWYIKAVKANASDEELWYNLGNALGKAGKKAERLYCFMRAEERGFTELKELVDDLLAQGIKPVDPRASPLPPRGS